MQRSVYKIYLSSFSLLSKKRQFLQYSVDEKIIYSMKINFFDFNLKNKSLTDKNM